MEGDRRFCRARGFIHFGLGRLVGVERVMYGYFFQNRWIFNFTFCPPLILCSLKCLTLLDFVLYYKIMSIWYLPYLVSFSGSYIFLDHWFSTTVSSISDPNNSGIFYVWVWDGVLTCVMWQIYLSNYVLFTLIAQSDSLKPSGGRRNL